MPYANIKGADQPVHPHNLISVFVVHCLDSIIPLVSIPKISSLYLASVAAQADFSLTWLQTPKTDFLMMWPICHPGWDYSKKISIILSIPVLNTNSVDPDQMPCSAASGLGLQCLLRSVFQCFRYIYVVFCPVHDRQDGHIPRTDLCQVWETSQGGSFL